MTLADLIVAAAEYHQAHPAQRIGQAHFNAVCGPATDDWPVRADFASRIAGSDADPFHDDQRLPEFWTAVAAEVDAARRAASERLARTLHLACEWCEGDESLCDGSECEK